MAQHLWDICAWTGFVWWCCAFIAATVIAGVAIVEALCARWEEDEIRRIAASSVRYPERAAVVDPEPKPSQAAAGELLTEAGSSSETDARLPLGGQGKGTPRTPRRDGGRDRTLERPATDLPSNWRNLDSLGSTEDAWAEMRRRKSGGA